MSGLLWFGLVMTAQAQPGDPGVDDETPGVTAELFETMVTRLADEAKAEAEAAAARGDLLAAVAALEEAVRWRPQDADALVRLGQLLHQLGHLDRAWQTLRRAQQLEPQQAGLLVELAEVASQRAATPNELAELAAALASSRERDGPGANLVLWQARIAARLRSWSEAERYYREVFATRPLDDNLRLEVGDLMRDSGRADEADRWYREVDAAGPAGALARERSWQLEVDQEARRFGWTRTGAQISEPARVATEHGRALFAAGRHAEAAEQLRTALAHSPQAAEARLWLAEVHWARGQRAEAELEFLRTLALEPGLARAHARLAELYLEDPAQPAAAVILLHRALLLRPDWSELHLHLAQAHRWVGELPQARRALETYLAGTPTAEGMAKALALRSALRALVNPGGDPRPESATQPNDALTGLSRVSALLARGEIDAAMAELNRAAAGESVQVRNLEGRILHAAGKLAEAVDAFGQSLAQDPGQAGVHEQLGVVLVELGRLDEAGDHFAAAAALGDIDAQFQAARLTLVQLEGSTWLRARRAAELWAARQQLVRYLQQGAATHRDEAQAELQRAQQWLGRLALVLLAGLLFPLLGLGWGLWRRWGGATLTHLLTRQPQLSPAVQEVLAAIRHEVLKHQTMALRAFVADGATLSADQRQGLLALLPPARGPWPLWQKFVGYVRRLEELGASAGLRLNLRRRDPTLAPVYAGLVALRRVAPAIRRAAERGLPPRLIAQLAAVSERLNVRAFAELERMVHELRLSRLDAALLERVFAAVRGEEAMAATAVAPLALQIDTDLPARIVVPRAALEDILTNLLRNALQAEARAGLSPLRVGVAVRGRVDPITGLEQLELGVGDLAPELPDLTRSSESSLGHGLSLVQQLVDRHDGRLSLENGQPPWIKTVVVSLPRDSAEVEPG